jgi:hypothetical protein
VTDDDELAHTLGSTRVLIRDATGAAGMSVAGLCQVCEAAQARHACPRCGRAVCDDHWDDAASACSVCVQGQRQ